MSPAARTLGATLALALAGAGVGTATAGACLTVGVYQDNPVADLPPLQHAVGAGLGVISTYLTAGRPLPASLIATANRDDAALMVTWEPDAGHDGAGQPGYRLRDVSDGRYDTSLRALATQLAGVRRGAILRPMPEMNTPWYAWAGAVNGNTAAEYRSAWSRVWREVRAAPGGNRIKLLWAPYAQSIPDSGTNQIGDYFPGPTEVDLVGASGYNFGAAGQLTWTDPTALFETAYAAIEAIAIKPFWIAETGSTSAGGSKAAWLDELAKLPAQMPELSGVVLYDVNDPTGDFRLRGGPVTAALRALLKEACR